MAAHTEDQKMLEGLEDDTKPLILSHRNIPAIDIKDITAFYTTGRRNDRTMEQLIEDGFEVMSVLVIREDCINYGASGASAVDHKIVTVMVKRKKE